MKSFEVEHNCVFSKQLLRGDCDPFGETFGLNVRSKPREDATLEHVGPTHTLSLLHGS